MNILDVKNLNLSFKIGGKYYQALKDVSFSLEKGSVLALAGESGSGKTMTAMSILRLIPNNAEITSGSIIYNGVNLLSLKEKEMQKIRGGKIALAPQNAAAALNPLYTIGEQIIEVIKIHQKIRGREAEKAAAEALEQVKIPNAKERLKSYPHEFSGGMCQRAVIAMALACRAEIIIADEPSASLDVTVQAEITSLFKEIKKEAGVSFIFISHDLGLISEFADKVCIMYSGRIVENSDAAEIFKNPKHPYTKALIKALPDFNSKKLEAIEGQPPSIKDAPAGCPFEPRCGSRLEKCRKTMPEECSVEGALVSCHLYN